MRFLISAGAVSLACAAIATPAQATYFVSGKHHSQIVFGKPGSHSDAWFGGKKTVKWPVVIIPSKPSLGGSLAEIIDKLLNPGSGSGKDIIKQIVETIFKHVHGLDNNHTPDCNPGDGGGSQPGDGGGNTGGGNTGGGNNGGGTNPGSGDGGTNPGGGGNGGTPAEEIPEQPGGVGSVPEPASWMTMILGFGAVGSALRARRRTPELA